MRQAARNLTMTGCRVLDRCRYLIRDRDTKFKSGFDMIFFGEASLRHAVTQYIEHYHGDRPHQGIGNVIPFPIEQAEVKPRDGPMVCCERLGGLLRSYHRKEAA